ncbi:MAG: histidine kinase [Pseudomonadota bacterium]
MQHRTIGLVALMWASVGAVHALSRYTDIVRYKLDIPFAIQDIGLYVISYSSWVVVTLVLLRIFSASSFVFSYRRLAAIFLVGALIWLPLYFAFDFTIGTLLAGGGWAEWLQRVSRTSGSIVFFYAVVYALTFALCIGVALGARARVAQETTALLERQQSKAAVELAKQQMQLMQSQLSPHFLFNSLSSISFLARSAEPIVQVDAIAKLGNLLRFTIENASRSTITVHEELQFAEDYLGLQSLRFGDRFVCDISCDSLVHGAPCPPFSLQPMLENVFRHVVEQIADGEEASAKSPVNIRAIVEQRGTDVFMSVRNSPNPSVGDPGKEVGSGTGMKNLRARLTHIYGDAFSLRHQASPENFCVELLFPNRAVSDAL